MTDRPVPPGLERYWKRPVSSLATLEQAKDRRLDEGAAPDVLAAPHGALVARAPHRVWGAAGRLVAPAT